MDDETESEITRLRNRLKVASRPGNWFFGGAIVALMLAEGFHVSNGWLIAIALAAGWAINEWERKSGA